MSGSGGGAAGGPSHCPECGLWYCEVNADGWVLWDEDPETGYDRYKKVNEVTGCMCAPEDLEAPDFSGLYSAADLDTMPF